MGQLDRANFEIFIQLKLYSVMKTVFTFTFVLTALAFGWSQSPSVHKFIFCPADLVINVSPDETGAFVMFANPIFRSDCTESPTVEQTEGQISGSFFPLGESQIEFTATSELCGDVVCAFTVTVQTSMVTTDLELSLATAAPELEVFQANEFTLSVTNTSDQDATNVAIQWDIDKMELVQVGNVPAVASQGNFGVFTKIWTVGTVRAGATATLTFSLFPLAEHASFFAQVIGCDQEDIDSTPSNGTCCLGKEDDEVGSALVSPSEITVNCPSSFVKEEATPLALPEVSDYGQATIVFPTATTDCELEGLNIELLTTENITQTATGDFIIEGFQAHEVTFEITDACGTTVTCSYVIDITRPELEYNFAYCPDPIVINVPTAAGGTTVFYPIPIFETNCPFDVVIENTVASGSFFPFGVTTVEYTATSDCEVTTCAFDIIVNEIVSTDLVDLDLSVTLLDDVGIYEAGTFRFTLSNLGGRTATGVALQLNTRADVLVQVGESEAIASQGEYGVFTSVWDVGELASGETATLDIQLFPLLGDANVYMQVISCNEGDIDSAPSNGTCCVANEDDEAVFLIEEGLIPPNTPAKAASHETTFNIYPNPAQQFLNIQNAAGIKDWHIFDAFGKLVLQGAAWNGEVIDITTLTDGVYYLQLHSENTSMTKSFVVVK